MAAVESSAWRHEPHGTDLVSSAMAACMVRCLPIAFVAAAALLVSVLGIAMLSGPAMQVPPSGPPFVAGSIGDAATIVGENLLVLILYAAGCVAMAIIQRWRGDARSMTGKGELMGRLATAIVIGLLLFAACRQAYVLGHRLAGFSEYFYASHWRRWLGVLPHALPELTGVFMPLAAWRLANRQGKQRELFACSRAARMLQAESGGVREALPNSSVAG
jgi:hypothetical protein